MEKNNVKSLKNVAAKLCSGYTPEMVKGDTISEVLDCIAEHYSGGGGGGKSITGFTLYPDSSGEIFGGDLTYSDGTTTPLVLEYPDALTLTSDAGSAVGKTAISVSPTVETGHHYKIKVLASASAVTPAKYTDVTDWDDWDGTSEITANKNNMLIVAECGEDNLVLKTGAVKVNAPIS